MTVPDLTTRQTQLLKSIIEEYIETAEPVGSETLDKKYNLGVSPATIRNEMVRLTQNGYLKQPHTSAGRVPTPIALKLYVNSLMKAKELSVADEVSVKQKMLDTNRLDRLLREATRALALYTHTMSLAATDEGDVYSAGMGNILEMPEFFDIDITKHLLETLDEYEYWWNLCSHTMIDSENLAVLLGEELGSRFLAQCGGVFIRFHSPTHKGMIGVVGPSRLNFPRIVPMVRYVGQLISEISKSEK
jgi:heat-inducible transcriptional repressor